MAYVAESSGILSPAEEAKGAGKSAINLKGDAKKAAGARWFQPEAAWAVAKERAQKCHIK